MWDKLERRFSKYAIPGLMNYIIGGYIIGYLLYLGSQFTSVNYMSFLLLDPHKILSIGADNIPIPQIWRLISWILIPPYMGTGLLNLFFGAIMLVFYWQLGNVLERSWGTFRFNCFIFGGFILTIIGAFILYAFTSQLLIGDIWYFSTSFSTNYINLSIFLAFALCYPDMQVLLYFVIPVKMKWMAIVYAVIIGYDLIRAFAGGSYGYVVMIAASIINFLIFYFSTRDSYHVSPRQRANQRQFRQRYATGSRNPFEGNPTQNTTQTKNYHHKCDICGRTDVTNPELTFRYCSKCQGNHEYCQDHLFTHTHII